MSNESTETNDLLAGFIDESFELLHELPEQLDAYRGDPEDAEAINFVFRGIHTVKGNAGFFGLSAIKQFAHSIENTLDSVREGGLLLSDDLARSLVAGFDILDAMLNEVLNGQISNELGDEQTNLLKQIEDLSAECAGDAAPEQRLIDEVLKLADEMERADSSHTDDWSARLRALVRNFQKEDEM